MSGRTPPHDLDAEAAVLSSIMLDRTALDAVLADLRPADFYSEANRRIYEAIAELAAAATPIDIVSVGSWLHDRGRLAQIGGAAYLAQISDTTPSVANVQTYATIVSDKARVRRIIATCQRIAAVGFDDVGDVNEWIDRAEHDVFEIAHVAKKNNYVTVGEVVKGAIAEMTETAARGDEITGIATGFARLDAKTAGLHDGDLTIMAARPGVGKTALALQIAANVACRQTDGEYTQGVAVHSVEMPKEQLAKRWTASDGRIDLSRLRCPTYLSEHDWSRLTDACSRLYRLPIWIDDSSSLGILDLRAKVRRLQAEYDRRPENGKPGRRICLVIVDYLQLMRASDRARTREEEISELSRGLKRLAKELSVPVIALAQLNRAVETRGSKDKRPLLSDLRESGSQEQDADNIIFIYRDDYYNSDAETKGIAELIIAKQRNGPTGTVKVRWDAASTRFDNLEQSEEPNGDNGKWNHLARGGPDEDDDKWEHPAFGRTHVRFVEPVPSIYEPKEKEEF